MSHLYEISFFSLGKEEYIFAFGAEVNNTCGRQVATHVHSAEGDHKALINIGIEPKAGAARIKNSTNLLLFEPLVGTPSLKPLLLEDEPWVWSDEDKLSMMKVEKEKDKLWDTNLEGYDGVLRKIHGRFYN
ncbi:hypothetical protein HDV00_003380 [Rhizophlyctis rosea]|nr:hypothetical protein HDV00_003380 [Rhizophlyctis rosea]